jgi:ATP-dependent DNA helicase RecG
MKTLGYVNTFGRGIARTQRLLSENGNPPAEFGISEPTFFLASVRKAVK